jgi:hypothetical protein
MVDIIWKADSHSAFQKDPAFCREPEGSLLCSQKPTTGPYPEPAESSSPQVIITSGTFHFHFLLKDWPKIASTRWIHFQVNGHVNKGYMHVAFKMSSRKLFSLQIVWWR